MIARFVGSYLVIPVAQCDGMRYIALSRSDAARVRANPRMLDHVRPRATLDIVDGARTWERPLGGADAREARAAIRTYLREAESSYLREAESWRYDGVASAFSIRDALGGAGCPVCGHLCPACPGHSRAGERCWQGICSLCTASPPCGPACPSCGVHADNWQCDEDQQVLS